MFFVQCKKLAIRYPTQSHALGFVLAPTPTSTLMALQNNNLFQKFMQTFMVRVSALAAPIALALALEARDNTDRLHKF